MTATNDTLFEQFVDAFCADGNTDPLDYVRRAAPESRLALANRIDDYLTHAPRRPLEQRPADDRTTEETVDAMMRSLAGHSGMWPSMLPRLRERARIKRSELVERLADALGVSARREKVAHYYHQMELGVLPPDGVSDLVLDALAAILGSSRERLREAAAQLGEPAADAPEAVFARQVSGEPAEVAALRSEDESQAPQLDEVDELFRGGR